MLSKVPTNVNVMGATGATTTGGVTTVVGGTVALGVVVCAAGAASLPPPPHAANAMAAQIAPRIWCKFNLVSSI
jgi:hypothetical protein